MKKIFKYLSLFLFIFLLLGGVYFIFQNIKIQNITCKSQFGACSKNLEFTIYNLQSKHKNIFETQSTLNNLLKSEPSILDYSIEFKFPLNFEVNVIERRAVVAFGSLLVDKDGKVIDKSSSTNLPKINSTISLDHDQIVYIANLVQAVYTLYKPAGNANVSLNGIEIIINSKNVVFPLSGDKDVLMGSLNLILSRLPSVKEATTIGTIDLRFKNPVLK